MFVMRERPEDYEEQPIKKGDLVIFKPWLFPRRSKGQGIITVLEKDGRGVTFRTKRGRIARCDVTSFMLVSSAPGGE
jgi:hypothetical protein